MATSRELAQQAAENTRADALALVETFTDGRVSDQVAEDYGIGPSSDLWELVDVMALEFYGTVRHYPYGQPTVLDSVTIVTGIGGPHTEIVVEDRAIEYSAYWGSERVTNFLYGDFSALLETLAAVVPESALS